jgi:hypothetical protein
MGKVKAKKQKVGSKGPRGRPFYCYYLLLVYAHCFPGDQVTVSELPLTDTVFFASDTVAGPVFTDPLVV